MSRIVTSTSQVIVPGPGSLTVQQQGKPASVQLDQTTADRVSLHIYDTHWNPITRVDDLAAPFVFDLAALPALLAPGKYNLEFRPTKAGKYLVGERRVCTLIVQPAPASPPPPPIAKPPTPPAPHAAATVGPGLNIGPLTDMVISKPIAGACLIERKKIIGAKGLTRLIDPSAGITQRFWHCEFTGGDAVSAAEETTFFPPGSNPYYAIFEHCIFDVRARYGLFFQPRRPDGKPILDPPAMYLDMVRCVMQTSDLETPLRCMEGVDVDIENSYIEDTRDIGGNKANAVARFHCRRVNIRNSTLKGMTKFGFELGTFPTDIECENVTFIGRVQFEGPIGKRVFRNCTLNGKPFEGN